MNFVKKKDIDGNYVRVVLLGLKHVILLDLSNIQ